MKKMIINHLMKFNHLFLICVLIPFLLHANVRLTTDSNGVRPVRFTRNLIEDTGQFDGNRIRASMENNGMIVSHRITGGSGMEWPKDDNTFVVFTAGIWMAGKVDGEIRTAVSEYGPERRPGPYGGDSDDADSKLYKVSQLDFSDPIANDDFQNWPVDDGAPWVDVDSDG
ncbi:MAG: hypothetical protein NZ735_05800, partial [Candidatus Marinimicrobia bacterium]|nr:hypothetical protein [Candidatus Neomarinimicrobiota bacterium]